MKFFTTVYLAIFILSSTFLVNAQEQSGERYDENLPDPILSSEEWRSLKPGQIYQGYLKLNSKWNNNWPLSWQLKGDNLKLSNLHDEWVRESYFKRSHKSSAHDPQGFLTSVEKDVLTDLLKNHDKVSLLPIHLFIFGADQQLVNMDAKVAGEEFLKTPNSTLMYYFIGDARATTGYVKTKKLQELPGSDDGDKEPKPLLDPFLVQTMFTKAGIHASTLDEDPTESLYTTVAEVSKRMYWIEQKLGLVIPSEPLMEEIQDVVSAEADEPSTIDKVWEQLGGNKQSLLYLGSGILIALLLIISAVVIIIYRRIRKYQFPDYNDSIRLAAKYGAGVSEVLAFKDARVSISDQKKRIEAGEE